MLMKNMANIEQEVEQVRDTRKKINPVDLLFKHSPAFEGLSEENIDVKKEELKKQILETTKTLDLKHSYIQKHTFCCN